jgi:DMSO reductase anchor subunit
MHPALSVIFFTTATGAGYGLLFWLGMLAAGGILPANKWFGASAVVFALALVTAGLLSSTLHLGRPERAWRAFSQWRTSWLSREGVASVITYVPACLFALGWFWFDGVTGVVAIAGVIAALCAVATVGTTGMIYASLKPVAQWHSPFTVPGYLVYALMSGAVLLNAAVALFDGASTALALQAIALIVAGWFCKGLTWRHDDAVRMPATLNSATGLRGGKVRSVEWPHTEENYVLKEMGYRIARKHAQRLRIVVHVCAFALPLVLLVTMIVTPPIPGVIAAVAAVLSQAVGLLTERWLFFAQAKHTVALYYGR